ncbi:MAG: hypothetical protein AAAFM81_15490 [Pseudomonadota bacterium]
MSRHIVKFAIGLLGCSMVATAGAQSVDQSNETQSGVVTITIDGANQVPAELAVAVTRLADAIDDLRQNGMNLSPDEIKEIDRVLNTLTVLIESAGENADQIDQAIRNAEEPLVGLTERLVARVDTALVSPALTRAEDTVERLERATSKARKTAVFTLLVLIAIVIGVLAWAGRQLSQFFDVIRRISDGHIIVPRSEWEARVPRQDTEQTP